MRAMSNNHKTHGQDDDHDQHHEGSLGGLLPCRPDHLADLTAGVDAECHSRRPGSVVIATTTATPATASRLMTRSKVEYSAK